MDELDILINEVMGLIDGKTQPETCDLLRAKAYREEAINYMVYGELSPRMIKQWGKTGKLAAMGVCNALTKSGQTYAEVLAGLSFCARVEYLVKAGIEKPLAEEVAQMVDENLQTNENKVDI